MEENDNVFTSVRWILADKKEEVNQLVRKIQNKSQKLSLPEPKIKFTGNEKIFQLPVYVDGELIPNATVPALKLEIVISGSIPRIDGFRFIAKISHLRDESSNEFSNIVIAPGKHSETLLKEANKDYHICTPNCDHCQKPRARQTTFLVSDDKDPKNIIQVGSTCVDDYTGTKSLSQVMGAFDIHAAIYNEPYWEEMDADYSKKPRQHISYPVDTFLAIANALTRKDGFVRSNESHSTKNRALSAINNPSGLPSHISSLVYQAFNEDKKGEDIEAAKKIINWIHSLPQNSNYISNAQNLLKRDYFEINTPTAAGILSSLPAAYIKSTQEQLLKEDLKAKNGIALNEPFGEPKERGGLKLSVTFIKEVTATNFPYVEYNMVDDAMRKFKWLASWPGSDQLESGKTYTLNGTIKKHTQYNNIHYTHVSRCSDIQIADTDTPVPLFSEGALKRKFKESFDFNLTIHNEKGIIDGYSYMEITREWREKSKIQRFTTHMTLPIKDNFEYMLISEMADRNGVQRSYGDTVDLNHKLDEKFITAAYASLTPYMVELTPSENTIYMVDDAHGPYFEHQNQKNWGKPNATNNDINKRKPQLFLDQSQAIAHGTSLSHSRMFALKAENWDPLLVDESVRMISIDDLDMLKNKASDNQYSAIAYMQKDGKPSKIEPLNWHENIINIKQNIISVKPLHDDVLPLDMKRKLGERYITITGIDDLDTINNVQRELKNIDTMLALLENKMVPQGLAEKEAGLISLSRLLNDDSMLEGAIKLRLVVVTDSVTSYYLKQMGADVIELNAGLSITQQISPDALDFSINNLKADLINIVKVELSDPERDYRRRF